LNNLDNIKFIDQYLFNKFKNLNKKTDFFIELNDNILNNLNLSNNLNSSNNYLNNLELFFKKQFIKINNKIIQSKFNSNLRLHWSDMRHDNLISFKIQHLNNALLKSINNQISLLLKNYKYEELLNKEITINVYQSILNSINNIKKYVLIFYNILNDKITSSLKLFETDKLKEEIEINIKYINKIKNKYENQEIKNKLNFFILIIKNLLKLIINNLDYLISNINLYINNFNNLFYLIYQNPIFDNAIIFMTNILRHIIKIDKYINNINNILVDIFTLRRILDKNYIQNVIIYSDSGFTMKHIFGLVNLFNFKIQNNVNFSTIFNSSNKNIDELNKSIQNIPRNLSYLYKIAIMFNLYENKNNYIS